MKKVLFFTHRLVGGGAEKTIINLAEYINKSISDWEAYIGVVYTDENIQRTLRSQVIVLSNRTTPEMNKLCKIPIVLKQARELKAIKKKMQFDTCVSFLPGSDFLNVLSKTGERVIISVRNKESFFAHSLFRKYYIKFCYVNADKIVAISNRVAYDICHFFGAPKEKVITIYNPSSETVISNQVTEEYRNLVSKKKVVITAGRLTKQKGQGYLIKAFSKVCMQIPNAHLVILGTGELETELKQLVHDLQMEDCITFMGFVNNPLDYIASADIFVFSSIVEGLGNALVEALQCGTPIISTDCDSGPRELLAPDSNYSFFTDRQENAEYGILVPVCLGDYMKNVNELTGQEKIMAEAICDMLEHADMRKQYRQRSAVRLQDFSIDRIVREWLQVIG